MAVAAMSSMVSLPVAPGGVQVAVAPQGSAVRRRLGGHLDDGLGLQLGEVRRHLALEGLADDPRRGVSDAGQLGQCARLGPFGQLLGLGATGNVEKPGSTPWS